ncbi:WD40-repeat-containing domain protein [Catenaria anguillulae PL171]|uniref:WD40-repeat-containing domain protein n=1 Tax=Catenaria anguillulae PL171 TaxID=765915 RepID=A0A1Y2HUP0_9FUNG|nr:WD40-repeat-containing domain protein [Catenaria anguillulae PL171]
MDSADHSCVYGLRNQTRAVCALSGEEDRTMFLVGTLGLASENELHVVEHLEETSTLVSAVFRHPHEISAIAACPVADAKHVVATSYNIVGDRSNRMRSTLWRLDSDIVDGLASNNGAVNLELEPILTFDDKFSKTGVCEIFFNATGSTSKIVGRDLSHLAIYSMSEGMSTAILGSTIPIVTSTAPSSPSSPSPVAPIHTACWNPHSVGPNLAVTHGSCISLVDIRSASVVGTLPDAHGKSTPVLTLDFNPNKPYQLMTGGNDATLRFWDLRHLIAGGGGSPMSPTAPTTMLLPATTAGGAAVATDAAKGAHPSGAQIHIEHGTHSHWITRAQYNRFHDQLVLSASADHSVQLASISSISSLPVGAGYSSASDSEEDGGAAGAGAREAGGKKEPLQDGPLLGLDYHEDSVYGLAWSAADPWTFCTASYDGRIVVNTVPSAIKYKIIL